MKKIYFSLLLMVGVSVFASEGPGGGADKYGNTNTGAESEDSDHGATLSASSTNTVDSAVAVQGHIVPASVAKRARSFLSRSTGANTLSRLFNNHLVLANIANFLTVPEAIHGFGLVNKTCHQIGNFRSRCAHAASVFKELVLEGHADFINSIAVMPDGRIVSGSSDRTIRVWNPAIAAGQPGHVVSLEGHTVIVYCIAVMSDGRIE
jgi:WD40 repeat protein